MHGEGCSFDVSANSVLKVKVEEDSAYLCEYVEEDEEEDESEDESESEDEEAEEIEE